MTPELSFAWDCGDAAVGAAVAASVEGTSLAVTMSRAHSPENQPAEHPLSSSQLLA